MNCLHVGATIGFSSMKRSPEYRRGVRQLAAWHEECRIRRLAAEGDEDAKKYLANRSKHIRSRAVDCERTNLGKGAA